MIRAVLLVFVIEVAAAVAATVCYLRGTPDPWKDS
jgi:hypothetical protein